MCIGEEFVVSSSAAACDFSLSPGAIAGIVIGILAIVSALACYTQSRKLGASFKDQQKWLLIGLFLPVVSIVVLNVLAKRGHFAKYRVTSPVPLPTAYEHSSDQYSGNPPTASETPLGGYGGNAPNASAPTTFNTQQFVSPAPYSSYDQPQPYSSASADYSNASAPYGQQQGYGYTQPGYSSAAPPYNNLSAA
jgi:hypothetical protein